MWLAQTMTKCFRQHQDTHIQPTFITSSTSSFWQSHNSSQPSLLLWPWKDLFLVPVAFKTPIPLFSCSKKVIRFFLFHLKQKTIDWTFFFSHWQCSHLSVQWTQLQKLSHSGSFLNKTQLPALWILCVWEIHSEKYTQKKNRHLCWLDREESSRRRCCCIEWIIKG